MRKMLVLLNHELSKEQEFDARNKLGIDFFIKPTHSIIIYWRNIEPTGKMNEKKLSEIRKWIGSNSQKGDCILVQGEFGVAFYIVDYCFKTGRIPVYSTSERIYREKKNTDGSIERYHLFHHVQFRLYERYSDE